MIDPNKVFKKLMRAHRDQLIFGTGYIKCDTAAEADFIEKLLRKVFNERGDLPE